MWNTGPMADQPTLARRALGLAFTRLRIERQLTPAQVGAAIGVSRQTIGRIEGGEQATHILKAQALCEFFKVSPEEKSRLCDLATRGTEKGWWEPYFDKRRGTAAAPKTPLFLETERSASRIWGLETEVIPGPLQTLEFLRAIQSAGLPILDDDAAAAQGLRAHRQKSHDERLDNPEMELIIGQAAIYYLNQLPAEVQDGQWARMREMADRPNVTIRVLNRLHAATANSFTILTPADDLPPFVYLDAVDGCRYIEDPDVVSLYERTFAAARENTEII